MDQPPYHEDFFQRIINVQWGGGAVFVFGELSGIAHYAKFQTKKDQHPVVVHDIPLPGVGSNSDITGSSYALVHGKPVFLLCGNSVTTENTVDGAGNPITLPVYHTMIYRSNDGLSWSAVYQFDGHIGFMTDNPNPQSFSANAVSLVWNPDEQAFYFDQVTHSENGPIEDIFQSSDGTGWGQVSSTPTHADPSYQSGFPFLCNKNDCFDARNQHVPDGVMVYDKAKNITVKPVKPPTTFYETGVHSYNFASGDPLETDGSSEVEVVRHTSAGPIAIGSSDTVSIPGIPKVFCVAGANGFYMAGGAADIAGTSGATAVSQDNGQTWQPFESFSTPITTMTAAPPAHFATG